MREEGEETEEFLRLLGKHERGLAAYVHALVARPEDADDLLQEAKLVMWRQFDRFESGTNFVAWARRIALHQILNYRRSQKRKTDSPVDPAFIEAVAAEIDRRPEHFERRSEALRECLRRLPLAHRQTIVLRYFEECDVAEIARRTERTEGAVYRLLSRIRQTLNDCVSRRLAASSG